MLPNRDNRGKKMPLIVGAEDGADLMSEACRRCMTRFVNAVNEQNVAAAMDAFKDLMAVHEYSEEATEEGE